MRHHSNIKKFGRKRDQRKALMHSLALALLERDRITTTKAKAKALRPYIEKMITKAVQGSGSVASRRFLASRLHNNDFAVKKLVDDLAVKYADRPGGYTRVLKLPARPGDAAEMAIIEFVN